VLGAGLLWICSWPFSAAGGYAAFRLWSSWLAAEPSWLRIGLIPVLGLGLGLLALALGGGLLAIFFFACSRAV
jgi:hypothetical protein